MSDYYKDFEDEDVLEDVLNTDSESTSTSGVNSKLSRDEREFHLWYLESEGVWEAESSIPKFWRKLEKKGWTCTGTQYYHDGTVCAKTFTSGNTKGVSITDPTRTRTMSEEQKLAASERFRAMHRNNAMNNEEDDEEDIDNE